MTTVYFVRHSEADNSVRDGRVRPLTEKGLADVRLVTEFLSDKSIHAVLSSPFKRAIDTVSDFASKNALPVLTDEGFSERRSGVEKQMTDKEGFWKFMERQWGDFSYALPEGECLAEVQTRNLTALNRALEKYENKNIAIGTHGTALSVIINYFDASYGFKEFTEMVHLTPWIVKMIFDKNRCGEIERIDLFRPSAAI